MKLVTLKCRIAFVVTMLVSYALTPTPDPFRKLHAGIKGSEASPIYSVMSTAPATTTAALFVLSATAGTATYSMLGVSADATTATAVTFADSTTALAPIRRAPITLAVGNVK